MATQTHAQKLHSDSSASSELNQPASDIEAHIQPDHLLEERQIQQHSLAADTEMADHNNDEFHTTIEPTVEHEAEDSSDEGIGIVMRARRWRARDIEAALGLTTAQGREFHEVVRDELRNVGLLGTMEGACTKPEYQEGLLQVVAATKARTEFLQAVDMPISRLDELILARARVNNDNEKHNERLVKSGRVYARAGTPRPAAQIIPVLQERGDSPQQPADMTNDSIASRTRSTSRGRRVTARPSVIAAIISSMSLTEEPNDAAMEIDYLPTTTSLTSAYPTRPPPIAPIFNTSIFHPTAFLVRMTHSPTGAAIHTSQLASPARRSFGSVLELHDMSYKTFLDMVSSQVGFHVEGRIEAVIPSSVGTAVLKKDAFIRLEGKETWMAVLQMWTNARMRTCEFVVDRDVDA